MEGYNITLNVNSKTLVGRVQDDLTVAAKLKSSLTKDDNGTEQISVVGHDVTFRASGLIVVDTSSGASSKLSAVEVMDMALVTGSGAKVPISYAVSSLATYTGYAIITNFTHSSNASGEEDAQWTADFQVVGNLTKQGTVTQGNS